MPPTAPSCDHFIVATFTEVPLLPSAASSQWSEPEASSFKKGTLSEPRIGVIWRWLTGRAEGPCG